MENYPVLYLFVDLVVVQVVDLVVVQAEFHTITDPKVLTLHAH